MGIIKTKGIILRESNFNDCDKMLTMLTPGIGKISCLAKGARRPRSLLLGGSQFLCFGDYIIFKGTNTYQINSCDTIEMFYNIRTDLEKLRYGVHITKIIDDVTVENQNSYKILQLFLNTIYVISEKEIQLDFVLAIFKIKLLTLLGYAPQIERCSCCKTKDDIKYFSIKSDGFICETCGKSDTSSIYINESVKNAIIYIVNMPTKKIFSFNIPNNDKKSLILISKIYLNEKMEKEYKLEDLF